MKKKVLSILLVCFMLFSLVACGNSNNSETSKGEEATSGDTIKIGEIGPQTGEVAVYGLTTLQGIELAIKEINAAGGVLDKKLELIAEDDKADPSEAVTVYNRLKNENVAAIIGSITSKPTDAVATNSTEDGIPIITPTGTMAAITEGKENVFRTCYIDPYQGKVLAAFAADKLGVKTAAVVRNTSDDYSNGVADAFIAKAKELGIEIVADEGYGANDVDFSAQLTNISQKNPELLLVPEYYEKDLLIAKQVKDLGMDVQIIGPDGWDGVLDIVNEDSLNCLEGVYFANHYAIDDKSEIVQNFVKNYHDEYDANPSAFAALGYDTVYLLKAAWEKAGTTDYAATIAALKDIDVQGVTGNLTFGENNNPIKTSSIIVIENGAYKFYDSIAVE